MIGLKNNFANSNITYVNFLHQLCIKLNKMAQAGLHAIIGYQTKRIIPYEKRIIPAIIFGSMLPDIDIIVVGIGSLFNNLMVAEKLFHRTFTHSFFTLIFVYLFFAILSELKKNPTFKSVGKGIAIGMLIHYLTDSILWFNKIDLLWPLPINPIDIWNSWSPPKPIIHALLTIEFFCFRWYAWFLIKKHYEKPNKHSWIIMHLNIWKNLETWIFLLFIFLTIWEVSWFKLVFGFAYIPSLIMALFSTYASRDALECKTE
ncbi:uncharacterized protein METZ01_LOCUS322410 [marine metagenome]|uniref:Uncharacterized protein n=1 Tax=marine metagenome TaxID=408172 RepID=A0A382P8H4_9ZZZZ